MFTTLIFLAIWMFYGVRVVKQQPDVMLFLSMVNEKTPMRASMMMAGCSLIWPVFKFRK